jgi:hypothetical protein
MLLTNHCKACGAFIDGESEYSFDDEYCQECSLAIEYTIEHDADKEE